MGLFHNSLNSLDDVPDRDRIFHNGATPLRPIERINPDSPKKNLKNSLSRNEKSFSEVMEKDSNQEASKDETKPIKRSVFELASDSEQEDVSLNRDKQELIGGMYASSSNKRKDSSINSQALDITMMLQQHTDIQAPPTPQTETIEDKARHRKAIQDVVDQLVRRLSVVTYYDRNEIIIELKYPPLFEGANLTITEFHHAKKEFNLAFSNLNSEAKLLLDQKLHQNELRAALEQKGYFVHMITTQVTYETKQSKLNEEYKGFNPQDDRPKDQQNKQPH